MIADVGFVPEGGGAKRDLSSEGPACPPATYHCLDVAATAAILCEKR